MSITVNIYYKGENGSARKFAEEMISSGTVEAIRNENGNIRYDYFYPIDDTETVLLIDSWENQEAIDVHHKTPMMDTIFKLREKYNLHMKVERYISNDEIPETDILNLTPEKKWDIGDVRPNGSKYDFANWAIGYCKDYNIDTSVQMEKSISILMDKKEELKQIREKNDAEFYLQVVPTLCVDESTPALAPSMTVMDFCYETRTQIDIDLYLED